MVNVEFELFELFELLGSFIISYILLNCFKFKQVFFDVKRAEKS